MRRQYIPKNDNLALIFREVYDPLMGKKEVFLIESGPLHQPGIGPGAQAVIQTMGSLNVTITPLMLVITAIIRNLLMS